MIRNVSYDKDAQIKKSKDRHGEDVFKRGGAIGGKKNKTKFNPETSKKALKARWDKYRAEQAKLKKEEDDA